jgi:uncharacterized protein (DUF1800 family)
VSALARYRPGSDGPFGAAEVRHLFRRGGFGLPWDECGELARRGLDAALAELGASDEGPEAAATARSADAAAASADPGDPSRGEPLRKLRALWLLRMVQTQAPLREKLALFWHGHFATSVEKVQQLRLIWRQVRLFRERGSGPFRELLQEVSRDPAMLIWLDSNSNGRILPNENYARELMELFSLGVGRYGEHDVREAARAFTGWHVRDDRFWFDAHEHDGGEKRILERSGALDGGDVVDLCVGQEACPRFLAAKLLRFYVTAEPGDEAVAEVAAALTEEGLAIGPTLERLLASRLFFASGARGALIQSPVEFCVATLRAARARAAWVEVATATAGMGQALFAPVNVKGWDGQRAWINSRTLLERGRFAEQLAYGGGALRAQVDWKEVAGAAFDGGGEALVGRLADALLGVAPGAATRAALVAFAASAAAGVGEARVRTLSHLLLSSPEAQLH